jgi:1-deoxy-D-xylulose-5-phosphate synthase
VRGLVTVEEHTGQGGFGSAVLEALAQAGVTRPARCLALPDRPIEHGNPDAQRAEEGLDVAGIARALRELAQRS